MADPRYYYRCQLLDVIDGDTLDVRIDLGFHLRQDARIRLAGINAPERRSGTPTERALGLAATTRVVDWCEARADRLILHTRKDSRDKFGRLLGTLIDQETGETLQDAMIKAGHAVAYDGQSARKPWGSA